MIAEPIIEGTNETNHTKYKGISRLKPSLALPASFFVFFLISSRIALNAQVITIDGNGTGQIYAGEGGVSAGASSRLLIDYPEPYRSQILDYLFKTNYGANLQDLKVELGGDVNSTDGSEPSHMHSATDQNYTRGYEWWLMSQAKQRNPNITLGALAWGAPGWIGGGNFYSQDMINYIINYINGAKSNYNLTINYIGIWNETSYNITWIENLKAALQAAGLSTKVVAADQGNANIVTDMENYPALLAAVDVVGMHYPAINGSSPLPSTFNKPFYASEDGPWRGDWTGVQYLVQAYNHTYIQAKITKHEIWSPVTSYYDIFDLPGSGLMYANTPWSGCYNVEPAIWATAHTTQFAQPGWQYIDSACALLGGGGSYVTLKSGTDYSVIIETVTAGSSQTLTFSVTNGLSTGTVHVWRSDSTNQFIQQSDIIPTNGSYSISIGPGTIYSLTTTTGQSKGNAQPPTPGAFPFPYTDNFQSYALSAQAHYFSDINGSFEITNCGGGRTGLCLRQTVNTNPIPWSLIGPFQPETVLGSTSWSDYQVSADVLLDEPGSAKIIGRFDGLNINSGDITAYQLYINNLGNWSLCIGDSETLASGTVPFSLNTWHNLKMVFNGAQIQVVIDGATNATVTSNNIGSGMAGLGTGGWNTAQFDNFSVQPLSSTNQLIPQSQMTATATSQTTGYEAYHAIDGNTSTFWVGAYSCNPTCAPSVPLPQSITLSLGGTYAVDEVQYLSRQDNNTSGDITTYKIYTSLDGINFTQVATGTWPASSTKQSCIFTPTNASYVRLEADATTDGYVNADEINVESLPVSPTNPPAITIQPQSMVVNAYNNATLSVTATGTAPLSYQWYFNGTNIPGATQSNFTIANVVQTNLGTYDVVVSNILGALTSSNAVLSMYPYIYDPFTGAVGYGNSPTTLSLQAWGTGPLTYQWYMNGVALPNATNSTLTIPSMQSTNAGLYSAVVSSALGSTTNAPAQVLEYPTLVSIGFYPGLIISGAAGYSYTIQSTTDLADTNQWTTLTTLTLSQPVQLWIDTNVMASSPYNPHYFYRVLPAQ